MFYVPRILTKALAQKLENPRLDYVFSLGNLFHPGNPRNKELFPSHPLKLNTVP